MDLGKRPIGRVSLDKGSRATIPLGKKDPEPTIVASLEWDGGSDARRSQGADLDLYALFVPAAEAVRGTDLPPGHVLERPPGGMLNRAAREARKAHGAELARRVDAGHAVFWKNLGALDEAPFIQLDGDSREPGTETIRVRRASAQGYALICAYSAVSNGFGSFRSYGARAVVTDGRGSTVTVPLYEENSFAYWVAIAFVDFTDPGGVGIQHVERYGRRWSESRPVLHTDGTIVMDRGPVQFKRG
ncbi:hypothetical protein [Actinacidiphila glaucinigra]|uniref:hypothetical protein n=1 Tax=Actinacidiphila glaucinigra TaxID=235986 RepID=UPI0035DC5C53